MDAADAPRKEAFLQRTRERQEGLMERLDRVFKELQEEGRENGPGIEDEIEPGGDDEC